MRERRQSGSTSSGYVWLGGSSRTSHCQDYYVPINTPVTIVVTGETKPEVKEDDHWEDERRQMLDDYD
jgi:hypothetical protein